MRSWTQLSASPCTTYFRWYRSLTMLTTPRRAHPRWWTTARPRTATSRRWEDAGVESQTERSGKLDWFGCGVGLHSVENNRSCRVEGWSGRRRGSVSLRSAKQRRWTPKARAGGPGSTEGRRREIQEECRPLDVNPTANMSESFFD